MRSSLGEQPARLFSKSAVFTNIMNTNQKHEVDYDVVRAFSSQLPEDFNVALLHRVMQSIEKEGLLGRWLFWSEMAEVAHRDGAIPNSKVRLFQGAIAFPFHMLAPGEPLIIAQYAVEPRKRGMDEGWYRVTNRLCGDHLMQSSLIERTEVAV